MTDYDFQERSRSPAYPYLHLKQAVELLHIFFDKHRYGKIPIAIALKDMGYSPTSGSGLRVIAALSQFGLTESEGSKESRRIWISELAKRILRENPNNPGDRLRALQEAALKPEIHAWVYERYELSSAPLPTDNVLAYDLETEMGFNEKAAEAFRKEFRETYNYAQLNNLEHKSEDEMPEIVEEATLSSVPHIRASMDSHQLPGNTRELTTLLTRGKMARLIIPTSMNRMDFQLLVRWLEVLTEAELYEEPNDEGN